MNTPLRRIRLGAMVLAAIFVLAVIGYRYLADYDWIHAVWMVVVTVSSVGYGEESQSPPHVQLLSIVVIVLGMSAAVYTVGGMIQLMFEGEIQSALGQRQTTRQIERLKDHVVICGYGRIGQMLVQDLRQQRIDIVVVDNDPAIVNEARDQGCLAVGGDATEEDVLLRCGMQAARTLVTVLPNDAANVFITLTGRNLNQDIHILARAEHPTTEKKLRQAGADRVVMPAVSGARQMARLITRPTTADLMELVAESSSIDVEMDEVLVGQTSSLVGASVSEVAPRDKHGLLVIAVKQPDGTMVFNPDSKRRFQANDTVIVMGGATAIERFRSACDVAPK